MTNALSQYLNRFLTEEIKQEAQEILELNKPDSILQIRFQKGMLGFTSCLYDGCEKHTVILKTFIPRDICLLDVGGDGENFWVANYMKFIPDEATAISLYFSFMKNKISTKTYFLWLRNILGNHYKLDISTYNIMLPSILGSRIYQNKGTDSFINGLNRLHRDILDFYHFERGYEKNNALEKSNLENLVVEEV